jgi:putative drug exporter of the RND superfamily
MFERLAHLITGQPRRIVVVATILAAAAGVFGANVASQLSPYGAVDPGTDSARSDALFTRATGLDPGIGLVALVDTGAPPRSPAARAKVLRVARAIAADPAVARVATFYDHRDRSLVSRDRRSQYAAVTFKAISDSERQDAADRLGTALDGNGVRVGGAAAAQAAGNAQVEEDLRRAELLAFPLLFLLSFVFFRSLVAAALPLLVGGLAIVATFPALKLAHELTDISVFALNLITGLGLGLAIDYSLFMVARFREELAATGSPPEAIARTLRTAGRTVLYSSLTVAAALASLLVFPQRFLYSMGIGGVIVTALASTVALVVLPAVLLLLGERVNALAPRWLQRRSAREARSQSEGAWYRLSRFVMRRPGRTAFLSAAVLIIVGLPFLRTEFTAIDATVLPETSIARQVDTRLKQEFPSGRTDPVTVAVESAPTRDLHAWAQRLGDLPGAAGVAPPQRVGSSASLVQVFPASGALTEESQQLVRSIRALEAPAPAYAGGQTAAFIDLKASLVRHLPWALAILAAATILVLFMMTGSIVLPLKALVMNVLTVSATFGLLVLVFQDGRLEGLLGYTSQGALEATQPIFLFAMAFGLSTDYGVFLLSRIKEARDAGVSDSESVAVGLERTGRIVTAAAALFSVAIGAFATSEMIFIKELGIGTALAVLIDATIVRALLVPSLMELLGHRNWWAPRPLRRLHRRIGLTETAPSSTPG